MKIISWNVNGYRAITGQNKKIRLDDVSYENKLFDYVKQENPDMICLQETKAEPSQIKEELIAPPGYEHHYNWCRIKKGYCGVVIFSKHKAKESKQEFGIEEFDQEGRFIEADFEDFVLMNVYFPNGQSGEKRLKYKLDFYDGLFGYANKLKKQGRKLIICGDYNTAHNEIDLARPKANKNTSGFMQIERDKIDEIIANGYVDTFREFSSEAEKYTWWSARFGARDRNVGWRIDYHMVTDDLMKNVTNSYHHDQVMGSDHCPIVIELDL